MFLDLKVQGHRGCAARHPENSIEGVCAALAAGAFAVEIDVHLTADDQLVVLHDEVITPPGYAIEAPLTVAEHPLHRLEGQFFGDGRDARFAHLDASTYPVQVPSLHSLLAHPSIPINKINIELKSDRRRRNRAYADAVANCLSNRMPFRVKSFDSDLLQAVQRRLPLPCYHYLIPETVLGDPGALPELEAMPWLEGVCMHWSQVDANTVARFSERGLHVSVYTVNLFDEAEKVYRLGVRDILSDNPSAMIDQLVFHNGDANPSDGLT
jgi:glycerophosphoryl diester phosphodiesterase